MTDSVETKPVAKRKGLDLGWLDMEEAPQDGKTIILTPDKKTEVPAIWRHTRRYDAQSNKWIERDFWAQQNAGGAPITFEPVGWLPQRGIL